MTRSPRLLIKMPFSGSAHLAQCTAWNCLSVSLLKGSNGCWQTLSKWKWLGRAWGHTSESPSSFFSSIQGDFFLHEVSNSIFYFHKKVTMLANFLTGNERSGAREGNLFLDSSAVIKSHHVWLGFCNRFCSYFGSFTGYRWICYTGRAPDNAGDLQGHGKKKMPRGQTCALES